MSRTLEKVREELEYVRVYYWAVRDSKGKKNFRFLDPKIDIAVEEYNQAIAKLENIKLFAVYTQIYIQGLKQNDLAKAWGVSKVYVWKLHKKLCEYFMTTLT